MTDVLCGNAVIVIVIFGDFKMNVYLIIDDTAYGLAPALICANSEEEIYKILKRDIVKYPDWKPEIVLIKNPNKKGIIQSWEPTGG